MLDTLSKDLSLVLKFHAHRSVRRKTFRGRYLVFVEAIVGAPFLAYSAQSLTAQSLNGAIVHGPFVSYTCPVGITITCRISNSSRLSAVCVVSGRLEVESRKTAVGADIGMQEGEL